MLRVHKHVFGVNHLFVISDSWCSLTGYKSSCKPEANFNHVFLLFCFQYSVFPRAVRLRLCSIRSSFFLPVLEQLIQEIVYFVNVWSDCHLPSRSVIIGFAPFFQHGPVGIIWQRFVSPCCTLCARPVLNFINDPCQEHSTGPFIVNFFLWILRYLTFSVNFDLYSPADTKLYSYFFPSHRSSVPLQVNVQNHVLKFSCPAAKSVCLSQIGVKATLMHLPRLINILI